jgi:hypothetical protein
MPSATIYYCPALLPDLLQLLLADRAPAYRMRWRPNPLHASSRSSGGNPSSSTASVASVAKGQTLRGATAVSPLAERRASMGSINPQQAPSEPHNSADAPSVTRAVSAPRARSHTAGTAHASEGGEDEDEGREEEEDGPAEDEDEEEDGEEGGDELGELRALPLRSTGSRPPRSAAAATHAPRRRGASGGVAGRRLGRRSSAPATTLPVLSAFDATAAAVSAAVTVAGASPNGTPATAESCCDSSVAALQPPTIPVPPAVLAVWSTQQQQQQQQQTSTAASEPSHSLGFAFSAPPVPAGNAAPIPPPPQASSLWRHRALLARLLDQPSTSPAPSAQTSSAEQSEPVGALLMPDWPELRETCRRQGYWPGLISAAVLHLQSLAKDAASAALLAAAPSSLPHSQVQSLPPRGLMPDGSLDAAAALSLRDAVCIAVHVDDLQGFENLLRSAIVLLAHGGRTAVPATVARILGDVAASLAAREAADRNPGSDLPASALPLPYTLTHAAVLDLLLSCVSPREAGSAVRHPAAAAFVPHVTMQWCVRAARMQRAAQTAWSQAAALVKSMSEYNGRRELQQHAADSVAANAPVRLPTLQRPLESRLAAYGLDVHEILPRMPRSGTAAGQGVCAGSTAGCAAPTMAAPVQLEDPRFGRQQAAESSDSATASGERAAAWMRLQGLSTWTDVAVPTASALEGTSSALPGLFPPSTYPSKTSDAMLQQRAGSVSAEAATGGLVTTARLQAVLEAQMEATLQKQRPPASTGGQPSSALNSSRRGGSGAGGSTSRASGGKSGKGTASGPTSRGSTLTGGASVSRTGGGRPQQPPTSDSGGRGGFPPAGQQRPPAPTSSSAAEPPLMAGW